jgi:exonuclease III
MSPKSIIFLNIRCLNARSHRNALRELVATERSSIVCIQETKLHVISDYDVVQFLGTGFAYCYLPADQTRGGILVA